MLSVSRLSLLQALKHGLIIVMKRFELAVGCEEGELLVIFRCLNFGAWLLICLNFCSWFLVWCLSFAKNGVVLICLSRVFGCLPWFPSISDGWLKLFSYLSFFGLLGSLILLLLIGLPILSPLVDTKLFCILFFDGFFHSSMALVVFGIEGFHGKMCPLWIFEVDEGDDVFDEGVIAGFVLDLSVVVVKVLLHGQLPLGEGDKSWSNEPPWLWSIVSSI